MAIFNFTSITNLLQDLHIDNIALITGNAQIQADLQLLHKDNLALGEKLDTIIAALTPPPVATQLNVKLGPAVKR